MWNNLFKNIFQFLLNIGHLYLYEYVYIFKVDPWWGQEPSRNTENSYFEESHKGPTSVLV